MTKETFENNQELYFEINKIERWIKHIFVDSALSLIRNRYNLPIKLVNEMEEVCKKIAEEHLERLKEKFESI